MSNQARNPIKVLPWTSLALTACQILTSLALPSSAQGRLWDKEPTLWESARKYQIVRPLAPKFGWEGLAGSPNPNAIVAKPGPEFAGPLGEGVNISNSRLQSSLWGTPDRLVLSIGKTDVYNRAGLNFTRGKKPVGQLLLLAEDFAGAPQPQVTTAIHDGTNRLELAKGQAKAALEVLLTGKESNVIALRARFTNLTKPPSLRLYRHKDKFNELADPVSGEGDGYFWIQQKFAPEKTFPDGFDYFLVAKVAGRPVKIKHDPMQRGLGAPVPYRDANAPGTAATAQLPAAANQEWVVYATVVTRAEAADPLAEAKRRLKSAEAGGYAALQAQNQKRYQALYAARERGRIFTGRFDDTKNVILPFIYQSAYQSRHTYNSNPDPYRYEGDANYNSIESDEVNWSGLQCFNEELYTGDFVAGRDESVADYYVKLFNFWRPAWEAHAKSKQAKGLYILRGYVPPIKGDVYSSPDPNAMNGCDWASMIWAFKSVWDTFDYGGKDNAFLRESVYPSLRGIAEFFASLTVLGTDGFYHIDPSQVREEDVGRDAIDCMGAAKWAFRTAIKASLILNVDADQRALWQERLAKMKPYYIIKNAAGEPVLASLVKGDQPMVVNHGASHFLVNVADEINLESPPELRKTAIRSNLHHHEQPMNRQVEYLLGESPDTLVMSPSYAWIHMFAHPAWLMYYAQKSGEGDFARTLELKTQAQKTIACWLEPERLCNSRSETIFFFPAVPGGIDIAFKDFQARGGFLVSGESKGGKVTYALIKARRSGTCAVMNPWPGRTLKIQAQPGNAAVPVKSLANGMVVFQAQAGTGYLLGT
jgi:hypothetical protein